MNHDEVREALHAQIVTLVRARDDMEDPEERAAASKAIEQLQDEVDDLDTIATNELAAKVEQIIEDLDEILNEKNLDAASALGRTIKHLRRSLDHPAAGGIDNTEG